MPQVVKQLISNFGKNYINLIDKIIDLVNAHYITPSGNNIMTLYLKQEDLSDLASIGRS